ncbi:MAG TPA: outer membrane protein transport protein [Dyella sp.]|uniref:outer membrane protein transport protein n=1 Tax=Dyella sp. TaxID=1869338 RepID=UPI002CF0D5CC|nr:outer membrane protein transport protein [Dyella sp.]HTV84690.1 outer membrane protein transport protein [Dyella sp.]
MATHSKPHMTRRYLHAALAVAVATTLAVPVVAQAGAFQLPTDNAAGWARANAGGSLFPDDPTAAYNNPAAMSFFSAPAFQGTLTEIRPQAQFSGQTLDVDGYATTGGNPNGFGKFVPFPNIGWVVPVNSWFALGGALAVPYGLESNYNSQWQGRYFGTETYLQSVNLSLSAAFKLNDRFSIGVGVLGQRTKAELNTVLDPNGAAKAIFGLPLTPGLDDEQLNVNVRRKFSWGFFGGMVFKPTDLDTLGFSYHSRVDNNLSGSYAVYGGATGKSLLTLAPLLDPSLPTINPNGASASAQFDTPAFASVDWLHTFTDRLTMAATVKWTQWSTFKELVLMSEGQQLLSLPEQFKDSYLFSVGGDYKLNDQWTVRGGIGYDQTPTNIISRDPRVPDGARKLLGFGLGYKLNQHISFDLGYEHQFVSNTPVHLTNQPILGGQTMDGYFADSGDVVSLTGTYHF